MRTSFKSIGILVTRTCENEISIFETLVAHPQLFGSVPGFVRRVDEGMRVLVFGFSKVAFFEAEGDEIGFSWEAKDKVRDRTEAG
jgi:hypothetical protein